MPRYLFDCIGCKRRKQIVRPMTEGADPAFCPDCGTLLDRIFTVPRIMIPEHTSAENDIFGIIARSTSDKDKKAVQEKYAQQNDEESDSIIGEAPIVSMDTILRSGIVEAAKSGIEAVNRWRENWVRPELEGIADEAGSSAEAS